MNSSAASNSVPKLSKTLFTFFLIVQLLFGLRFGFIKPISNAVAAAEKLYCSIPCLFMTYFIYFLYDNNIFMVFLHYLEFYSCMIVLLRVKYTLYNFLIESAIVVKDLLKDRHDSNIGAKVAIFTTICFLFKCSMSILFCLYPVTYSYCSGISYQIFFHYIWVTHGVDILTVVQLLIIHTAYESFKCLHEALKTGEVSVKVILKKYIELSDTGDKVIPMFDKLFLVGLFVNFPKGMFITYHSLQTFKQHKDWIAFLVQYSYVIHLGFLLCMPAAMGEMMSIQFESIKLTLHNRLIQETDKETRREIKCLLRYICGRPVHHRVWHVIPLDLRLPTSLFSMFVTYLIVIIQFTHLFD